MLAPTALLLALALPSLAAQDASPTLEELELIGSTPGTAGRPDDVPEGLRATDWSSIRQAYEAGRHTAQPVAGGHRAANPGQRWQTHFDGRGFTTEPDAGGWTWGLELVRYGFAGQEREVARPTGVSAVGQRVTYDWDVGLEEWYVNDTRGLEHGYTVQQRPPGPQGKPGPLTFVLAVRGGLTPEVQEGGRDVRFVDGAGTTVLTYTGLTVFDADGQTLAARFERATEGLCLRVDERGARYPLTIDPIAQQAYLKASNTDAADLFGQSVAVSGDTVVVGAKYEDSSATGVDGDQSDNSTRNAGAAYVFVRSGATWSQEAYLKASNTDADDEFGSWLAVSGDTVVVGAGREDSNATGVNGNQVDNSAEEAGAAYVFVRSGTTWSQQAYLKASNTGAGDGFGSSVTVCGDTVVVGAPGESSNAIGVNGNQNNDDTVSAGAAYVFVRSGTNWSQQAYVKASNPGSVDVFYTVAVSNDTLVVGAAGEDSGATGINGDQGDNSALNAGAAYVFERFGTNWTQQAYLKASNTEAGDEFGRGAAAVSGDTIVVGAFSEASNATGVNGDQNNNDTQQAGAVYVFVRTATIFNPQWSQEAYLKASNPGPFDRFGWSVAVSNDTVVVGAWGEDSNATGVNGNQADDSAIFSGAAYVFLRNGTTWSQEAYLKASNTDMHDHFGVSVAVSDDTVVIGAEQEQSGATGVNGNQGDNSASDAGAVYVFEAPLLASVTSRNAGSNPASYSASPPVLGSTWTATVDLTTTGHSFAQVLGYTSPATLTLAAGQVLLVGGTKVFALPLRAGPIAVWSEPLPNDPMFVGGTLYTQAAHILGVSPFALSNAQDLQVGF